jgi:hypothetical protein
MPQSPLTVNFKEKPTFRVWCLYSSFVHAVQGVLRSRIRQKVRENPVFIIDISKYGENSDKIRNSNIIKQKVQLMVFDLYI